MPKVMTQTAKDAQECFCRITNVCRRFELTYFEWSIALFENGCRFVERMIGDPATREQLLKNEEYKFWDWWWMQYVGDDTWVSLYVSGRKAEYFEAKEKFVDVQQLFDNFQHYLNQCNDL